MRDLEREKERVEKAGGRQREREGGQRSRERKRRKCRGLPHP